MSQNEDGERELVLGNKQLLAIFFVAALLCGVFFAMGYVVGGNSAKSAAAAAATDSAPATTAEGKREEPQAAPLSEAPAPAAATAATGDMGSQLPAAEPRVTDNPAAAGALPPAPVPAAPQPERTTSAPKTVTPGPQAAAATVYISVPEKGTSYWQVTAVGRPAADDLVRMLRERQLPAILAESSNPKLFRVLVGPYRSPLALAEAKKKVMDVGGFDGLIPAKY